MPEIFDERRQEPRFATSGEALFSFADRHYGATLLDVSLNGLKVSRPESCSIPRGERFRLDLAIPGTDRFSAEVTLVHAEDAILGLEFYDMPPRDFGLLASLIEQFLRLRRQNGGVPWA